MCGIVGYIGRRQAAPMLLEGLHRLEYRGYDSAGVALVNRGRLKVTKAAVRVNELRELVDAHAPATIGIAHTRWATHGEPTEANAHPQLDTARRIAVVHNGIIENADELRTRLNSDGVSLVSDTDTEVLPHLIARALDNGAQSLTEAVRVTLREIRGAYGIVVLDAKDPTQLVAARNGSPIVLGVGDGEMHVASDVAALVRHTQRVVYLDDGELATVTAQDFHTTTLQA
ncbi:MAG: glutamine--fructose-6-phosphate transaminase (isomerizing), partial [Mycobacteriales bacterium]